MEVIIGQVQDIRFGVVGAAHDNGVSECSIKAVTYMACTTMMHVSMRRSEGFITTSIWPLDMDYAWWVYNRTPKESTGFSAY